MKPELKKYISFKMKQHCRIHGLDRASKEEMTLAVKRNMERWVREAVAAGV